MMMTRCSWCGEDPLYVEYHDKEWGVPVRDDRTLFEMLVLDGAQAGLSWITILRKRTAYREAFDGFETVLVARYDEKKIELLMRHSGIVRSRRKIVSAVNNARVVLELQDRHGSLADFLWSFVGGRTIQNAWRSWEETPSSSRESRAMSEALKAAGCGFVGPTILYAFMQASGMVNDHITSCFRYRELGGTGA